LLFTQISEALRQNGFSATDGKVDGLDAFRGEIIRKIRDARLFVCLLTTREPLHDGSFASSVWLYQETGAAIALGKNPFYWSKRECISITRASCKRPMNIFRSTGTIF